MVVIATALGDHLRTGQRLTQVKPDSVSLANGEHFQARAVIDGRGVRNSDRMMLERQAILGQLLQLQAPHGLEAPIIMDARVAQGQGYLFVYKLPFSTMRLAALPSARRALPRRRGFSIQPRAAAP
ncbi:hypothetical protein J3P80_10755 [Pseudomonas sp. D2-30]